MVAHESIQTKRLLLRRPQRQDAAAIFVRYASDPEVTRLLAWPRHRSLADTLAFITLSDDSWAHWHVGPLLIEWRADGRLLGSTGLDMDSPASASTGYVLARDSWGQGLATEALHAIVAHADSLGFARLHATCHISHHRSQRVLEKCGFACTGAASLHIGFPNLEPGVTQDAFVYARAAAYMTKNA